MNASITRLWLIVGIAFSFCSRLNAEPPLREAVITVLRDGSILYEKGTYSIETISKALSDHGFGAGSHVLVKADPEASYQIGKSVLEALDQPAREIAFQADESESKAAIKATKATSAIRDRPIRKVPVETLGIAAESKRNDQERYFTVLKGVTPTLHLKNDTGATVLFLTENGDTRSGKPVLRADLVLTTRPNKAIVSPLCDWLERNFVFTHEKVPQRLMYFAPPNTEFDVVMDFTCLTKANVSRSKRKPLPKGSYRFLLQLFNAEQMAQSSSSGLPPSPLLSYQLDIR